MSRRALPIAELVIVFMGAASALAQSSPASSPPAAFSPLVASPTPAATPATSPGTAKSASPNTAALLAIGAPKYIPSATPKAAETAPDRRETDRPRNGIIRLPDYVVRDPKAPVYSEDQFLTPEARLQRTYARHRGLGARGLLKNDPAAHRLQEDDERVARRSQMTDLLSVLQVGSDPAVERAVRAQVRSLYMNSTTWLTTGGSLLQSREQRQ